MNFFPQYNYGFVNSVFSDSLEYVISTKTVCRVSLDIQASQNGENGESSLKACLTSNSRKSGPDRRQDT